MTSRREEEGVVSRCSSSQNTMRMVYSTTSQQAIASWQVLTHQHTHLHTQECRHKYLVKSKLFPSGMRNLSTCGSLTPSPPLFIHTTRLLSAWGGEYSGVNRPQGHRTSVLRGQRSAALRGDLSVAPCSLVGLHVPQCRLDVTSINWTDVRLPTTHRHL